jgi:predicted short-subunit dehydrogenase-like oxidoreductase (DUF2520 family)
MHSIRKIALAGAGNVAWHLATELQNQGFVISGIWSRDYANAALLAENCASAAFQNLPDLAQVADLIIIAVPDKAIADTAGKIGEFEGVVVHTAGSVPMDIFKGIHKNYGILYPLQTFSKETSLNISEVPFFIEASSAETLLSIKKLALQLSDKVFETDSKNRMLVHVAAVFASNYANLMYVIGNELITSFNLQKEVLLPLITETASKAVAGDPYLLQTGPARRKDWPTVEKHIEALASFPEYAELYRILATLISKKYQ